MVREMMELDVPQLRRFGGLPARSGSGELDVTAAARDPGIERSGIASDDRIGRLQHPGHRQGTPPSERLASANARGRPGSAPPEAIVAQELLVRGQVG